ncbi:Transposase DDE domain-containing protein [Collimonas sp. OK607]|nr:Transposase DDE domain-containing protein [Collimonas sp. OK607]
MLDTMQTRIDNSRDKMKLRRCTVEHVFGTVKSWMGSGHFTMKGLAHVGTEISLHILAYNMRRVMAILGITDMMKAMKIIGA